MRLSILGVALSFIAVCASAAFATTTDELMITSGSLTVTILDNGSCSGTGCADFQGSGADMNSSAGAIQVSTAPNNFNGWEITFVGGASNSPGLTPYGLDILALTAECFSGSCTGVNALNITYSDINFGIPVGVNGFTTTYTGTDTGAGNTSQSAYFSNTNTLFAQTTLIGTVTPGNSASGGGIAAVPNYSMTLVDTFSAGTSFSVDGNITGVAVPEPMSIILLGTLLCLSASAFRRRSHSSGGH